MAETSYIVDTFNRNWKYILAMAIDKDCRCVKEVRVYVDPMSFCCKVKVSRIDTGIWEWNDEVIPC